VFSARTLDDTKLYPASFEVNARNKTWVSDAPGKDGGGLSWRNKYGFVGATWSSETPGVYDDGMNEHGLSVAQNQLDETIYPNVTDATRAVGMRSVVGWLLGSASTVTEARALLSSSDYQVWGRPGGGPGGDSGAESQHLHILDAAGDELLAEWMHGEQRLYGASEGAWGTTTNSPAFPVMSALREYQTSFPTSFSSPAATIAGGRGGLNGVPGAFDSWSRQEKARMLNFVRPLCTKVSEAVAWSFRMIDALSVPGVPTSATPLPADGTGDFTQWQIVRDHASRVLYSRTWDNQMPKMLSLGTLDFSEGAATRTFVMGGGDWAENLKPLE
jgi:penicillin V acylase-like amidase (Ntn superfamily)